VKNRTWRRERDSENRKSRKHPQNFLITGLFIFALNADPYLFLEKKK
jgi:hypothetical protein